MKSATKHRPGCTGVTNFESIVSSVLHIVNTIILNSTNSEGLSYKLVSNLDGILTLTKNGRTIYHSYFKDEIIEGTFADIGLSSTIDIVSSTPMIGEINFISATASTSSLAQEIWEEYTLRVNALQDIGQMVSKILK